MSASKCDTCNKKCWSFEWSGDENDVSVCKTCYQDESLKYNGLAADGERKAMESVGEKPDDTRGADAAALATSPNFELEFKEIDEWLVSAGLEAKPHQREGFKWLFQRETKTEKIFGGSPGGIVADEMGLGKTILMIGLMLSRFVPRTLIVVPPALLSQWASEIKKTTGHKVLIFHGHYKSSITIKELTSTPIVLTTYGHVAQEKANLLHMVQWNRVIFDEAHHLRNQKKNFRGAKQLHRDFVWMLTGTPIQNAIKDLNSYWKILNVKIEYGKFDLETYHKLKEAYILRRTKLSVNLELPPIRVETIKVDWETDEERDFAEEIHAALPFSNSKATPRAMVAEMTKWAITAMVRGRQVCTKTALMMKVMTNIQQDVIVDSETERETDCDTDDETARSEMPRSEMPCVLNQSKLNAVVGKILERRENGRKKLIFSHYRGEIDELKKMLTEQGLCVDYFDGRVSATQRQRILKANDADVLILQIKTACEGLNLQHFKEVYFVTPHWNPAVEDQAVARCHRIGQTDEVNVFRFEMENFGLLTQTIDAYCTQVQEKKRELHELIE
jgi:SNF2 family DNA or RNA helicase